MFLRRVRPGDTVPDSLGRRLGWPWPTLEQKFSPKANGFGWMRIVLATAVLIGHSWILAEGGDNLWADITHEQTDVGALAVFGFFLISGFLISASGMRFGLVRFAWHRFLRIFPGFWVCLLVTAFGLAPLVALYEHGTLSGFFTHPAGPFDYVFRNITTGMNQYTISGLLADTPYGRLSGEGVWDGSLWSLIYELSCYGLVALLVVTLVFKRARWVVPLLAAAAYGVILWDFLRGDGWIVEPGDHGQIGPIPLVGYLDVQLLIYLGFVFLLGATAQVYRHRVPIHPALAVVALVAVVASMLFGAFFVIGLPSYCYLLLWLGCSGPAALTGIGRRRDYSYGIYIYAFPIQMIGALVGTTRWGIFPYIVISLSVTLLFAAASWHLVESRAMRLKSWTPRLLSELTSTRVRTVESPAEPAPGAAPRAAQQGEAL